jgi:hypothetical protein
MSATIPVRTAGGQVLMVPPLRLSWASTRPRLVELMDALKDMQLGRWTGIEKDRLGICSEFLAEVVKAAGYQGPELEADLVDVMSVHAALRGVQADPTPASPEGSGT